MEAAPRPHPIADANRLWRGARLLLAALLLRLSAAVDGQPPGSAGGGPSAADAATAAARGLSPWEPQPTLGAQRLLVILTDFSDQACVKTGQEWAERFFGDGGFADFFRQNSYGQLRYYGDVVGMTAQGAPVINSSKVDCLRLPETLEYYCNGRYGFRIERCGRGGHGGIYHDALAKLDAAGFDFSPYADPITKQLRNVVVIASAMSFNVFGDPNRTMLSTAYEMKYTFYNCQDDPSLSVNSLGHFVSSAGFFANQYTFCTGHTFDDKDFSALGVCIHEQGHAIGVTDLWGIGSYGLMGPGMWGPDHKGKYPSHFGPFEKILYGWVEPTLVHESEAEMELVLRPSHVHPDVLKLALNGTEEYFLVENRQELAFGSPAAHGMAPKFCPGVIVWHIDGSIASRKSPHWQQNSVNNLGVDRPPPHRGVTVEEAVGDRDIDTYHLECNDTYRLGHGVFSGSNAVLWDGTDSGVELRVLTRPDADRAVRVGIRCPRCLAGGVLGATATSTTATAAAPEVDVPTNSTRTNRSLTTTPSATTSSVRRDSTEMELLYKYVVDAAHRGVGGSSLAWLGLSVALRFLM